MSEARQIALGEIAACFLLLSVPLALLRVALVSEHGIGQFLALVASGGCLGIAVGRMMGGRETAMIDSLLGFIGGAVLTEFGIACFCMLRLLV